MINILLEGYDIDVIWLYDTLKNHIKQLIRLLLLHLNILSAILIYK